MPYRPKKSKKTSPKPGSMEADQIRANQFLDQRNRDLQTRSILSRLRNRKSDLK